MAKKKSSGQYLLGSMETPRDAALSALDRFIEPLCQVSIPFRGGSFDSWLGRSEPVSLTLSLHVGETVAGQFRNHAERCENAFETLVKEWKAYQRFKPNIKKLRLEGYSAEDIDLLCGSNQELRHAEAMFEFSVDELERWRSNLKAELRRDKNGSKLPKFNDTTKRNIKEANKWLDWKEERMGQGVKKPLMADYLETIKNSLKPETEDLNAGVKAIKKYGLRKTYRNA